MVRLLAVLVLAGASVNAQTNTSGVWQYTISNGEARITGYTGVGGAVIIPNKVGLTETPVSVIGRDLEPNHKSVFGNSQNYNSSVTSITIQAGVKNIERYAFFNTENLLNIIVPESVTSIGDGAFDSCPNITNIVVPSRFMTQLSRIGFKDNVAAQAATDYFLSALATNEAFVSAVANKILAASNNYGLATKTEVGGAVTMGVQQVLSAPSDYNLFTTQQVQNERTAGQNDVLNTPNSFSLYTTNQIHNLGLGGIVLNRNTNNQLVLNYQVLQSSDLQSWSPYQQVELVVSNAPSDKMFLRVQAVENIPYSTQSYTGPSEPPPAAPVPGPAPAPNPPGGSEPENPGLRER
jgi:hypothetical protein